jgi:hypothetical protein
MFRVSCLFEFRSLLISVCFRYFFLFVFLLFELEIEVLDHFVDNKLLSRLECHIDISIVSYCSA